VYSTKRRLIYHSELEEWFQEHGWDHNRHIDVDKLIARLVKSGFSSNALAAEILETVSKLVLP
jgi:hypothetical protein